MDGSARDLAAGEETLSTLAGHARGRFGRIDPRRIAELIVANTPDGDWTACDRHWTRSRAATASRNETVSRSPLVSHLSQRSAPTEHAAATGAAAKLGLTTRPSHRWHRFA